MTMLRELGDLERFPYVASLGIDPDDVGRLDVLGDRSEQDGMIVDAVTGEFRLVSAGDPIPAGVWVAQTDIDVVKSGPGSRPDPHGFGEGFGAQASQLGGDRSFAEEDTGGTSRAPEEETLGEVAQPVEE